MTDANSWSTDPVLARIGSALAKMGLEDVGPDDPLVPFGLDSLGLAELADILMSQFGRQAIPSQLTQRQVESLTGRVLVEEFATGAVPESPTPLLRLRPVRDQDVPWLREIALGLDEVHRFVFRGAAVPPTRFVDDIFSNSLSCTVAETADGSDGIGFLTLMAADPQSLHASLGALIAPHWRGSFHAMHAIHGMIAHGFRNFPLRRIYLEVPDFNLAPREDAILRRCGRIEEHLYFDGTYWGVTFYYVERDDLPRLAALSGAAA